MVNCAFIRGLLVMLALWPIVGCGGGTPLQGGSTGGETGGGTGGGGTPGSNPPSSAYNIVTSEQRAAYHNTILPDFSAVTSAATTGLATPFMTPVTTGSATYDGYMRLIMGNTTVSANVIGNATLLVRFDGGAVNGTATDFLGVTLDEALFQQVVSYDGTIGISGGGVTVGTDGSADVSFDVDGQLINGVNTFAVDGALVGGFNGDGADGLYAIGSNSNLHGTMQVTIDGIAGPGNIGIGTVSGIRQ